MKAKIKEAILVEGRYDINTVRQVVDTVVLETGGFRIFKDDEKLNLLRRIAETRGLIILTDSDGAGFVIRGYLKGALAAGTVKQAYVPDITGKERRKRHGSKEGKLGVEGMRPETILEALQRAGATFEDTAPEPSREQITKADLYTMGLTGQPDSARLRQQLLHALKLPEHMTPNSLLDFMNATSTREEIQQALQSIARVEQNG
ncbi:DUF4093 domain-containing protein [Butyricicoccus faecihominis]|uniref:toprim domain-containing protein n=1 Tax=Butyricicoccus faecihominis TaxID=1712515 RepID=UPI002479754D|nr:DUF4093 domain-containing protein [Butyricicoccus faecihominis]MCQ5129833.1 DUF4093 domain-containing protein [Butyricicoccus faecihominis]